MPIEFAPPSPSLQGFQIAPASSTDPLQTLAQMGQLRTQNLQQQQASMQLENERMRLDSQKGLLSAMTQAGTDGTAEERFQRVMNLASQPGSKVLPADLIATQQHYNQLLQEAATRKKTENENMATDIDRLRGIYEPLTRPGATDQDFAAANAKADALGIDKRIPRLTQWTDPEHVVAHSNGLALHSQLLNEAKEGAATEASQAATAASRATAAKEAVATTEAQQKVDLGTRAAALAEIRSAPVDPTTQTPTPAAWQGIISNPKYKGLNLPPQPTQADIDRLEESTIPPKEIPEYRIKKAEAAAIKAYAAASPQDLERQVDQIMPPSDPMNAPTKALLKAAIGRGDFKGVQSIFKDAYDQRGRVQVAKETAANKLSIEMSGWNRMLGAGPGGGGAAGSDLHGEEYLATLNPTLAARVKQIATGNEPLPTGRAAMSGPGALLANAVYQYDPQYTPLLAQKRREMLSDYTKTSGAGGNILALQTFIHHADLYQEVADALQNGTFKPGNAAWNAVLDTFGKAPPVQADLVAQFLAGETAKVAGENTGGAVNEILQRLKSSNSPEQIRGAGQSLMGIAAGRLVPHKERIADAHLEGLVPPLVGPSEREILVRRGFDPETLKPAKAPAAHKVGDTVYYQGKPHTITAIDPKTGKLSLTAQ